MTCTQCRRFIKQCDIGQLPPSGVLEHAGQCSACYTLLTALRMVREPGHMPTTPPDGLSERVAMSILQPIAGRGQRADSLPWPQLQPDAQHSDGSRSSDTHCRIGDVPYPPTAAAHAKPPGDIGVVDF